MSRQSSNERQHRKEIQNSRIAATLSDGPKTLNEILDVFYAYLSVLGIFKGTKRQERARPSFVRDRLEKLIERGSIVLEGERYALTRQGREEVDKRLSELGETGAKVRKFLISQNASKVTLAIHIGLAALKLPLGLLSGSAGLLSDAADTLLDAVSSLMVYFGLRFNKERLANVGLVVLMLITGALTFYEAARRFFVVSTVTVDWYTFLAVIISAIISLALWTYQRYVGLRSSSIALVTQSVDSRNHVLVAVGVTVGLIASRLRFPLLDTMVGLTVAILILKSAIQLAMETIRSWAEGEMDLSHYKFALSGLFEWFRQMQLRKWLLDRVEGAEIQSRAELVAQGHQALNPYKVTALRAMGLAQSQPLADDTIERNIAELVERGWIAEGKRLRLTEAGRKHLGPWA